ncbi:phospholipase D-like domain-containing protein [Haloimpatiens massiliensis]|uniref:phospholipase D-like domain-containing protein n=1 Tax=Haloimpatiens massiliensis TaxID=1658110 RepID=UPI000C846026|nr:phospholipase D-like domain-containing protein [Haloimpatiens massiliensis]
MKSINEIISVKDRNDNYNAYFERILDNNPKFIIASSFSFFLPPSLWNRFNKLQCPKLVIIPYEYEYRDAKKMINKRIINELKKIEYIICSGTTVIINSVNHAKYMITDKDCFVGSNNLTSGGIEDNVENSHFMYNRSGYYQYWKDEILKFVNNETIGFAALEKLKEEQQILNNIIIYELDNWMVNKQEFYNVLNNMHSLKKSLYRVNDCYQHIGAEVRGLIVETCPIIKKIDIIKNKLEEVYWKLDREYEKKKQNDNIFITKRDLNMINPRIEDIKLDLKQLNLYRVELFKKYENTWRRDQSIYEYLQDKEKNENLTNLKNFINRVIR